MSTGARSTAVASAALMVASGALAADPPKKPWSDVAEFGFVMTTGNAEGTNLAFANKFKYAWSNAELTFDGAALHAESTTRSITNPGPPYGTAVVTDTTATTASSYGLALMYRQNISERFYWLVGASWYQNFFAGIDDRYIATGGVGYTLVKDARNLLKGELGLDFTRQVPLDGPPPEVPTEDFLGLRAYLGYEFKISEKSKLTEDLNFFSNFDTSSAWRVNSVTALTAGFTDSLALKVSYTVLYSNEPLYKNIPPLGGDPSTDASARYTFESTDTILAVALVVNF
jgi:putative salt-induced outer membrane protein YdiY